MSLLFDEDALSGIPPQDLHRILEKAEWLWANRKLITQHPLSHSLSGVYKRRLGKYRILYTYDSNPDELVVRLVGLRDDIYRDAR